jgi:hypothetical protein
MSLGRKAEFEMLLTSRQNTSLASNADAAVDTAATGC